MFQSEEVKVSGEGETETELRRVVAPLWRRGRGGGGGGGGGELIEEGVGVGGGRCVELMEESLEFDLKPQDETAG